MIQLIIRIKQFIDNSPTISSIVAGLIIATFLGIFNFSKKKISDKSKKNRNAQIAAKGLEVDVPSTEGRYTDSRPTSFSSQRNVIVNGVNSVHRLYGFSYDFGLDHDRAQLDIRAKGSDHWWISPASLLANAIQSGGIRLGINRFMDSFEVGDSEEEKLKFKDQKSRLEYLYDRIQNMRHVDKGGELKNELLSPFALKMQPDVSISDEQYEDILRNYLELLYSLFKEYRLKKKI